MVRFIKEIKREDIQESDLSLVGCFWYADTERPVWGNDIWAETQGDKYVKSWKESQMYKSRVDMSITVTGQKEDQCVQV